MKMTYIWSKVSGNFILSFSQEKSNGKGTMELGIQVCGNSCFFASSVHFLQKNDQDLVVKATLVGAGMLTFICNA